MSLRPEAMTHRALFVCDVAGAAHPRKLWNVGGRYVVTSASCVFGAETYVFHADLQGEITDYLELPGSYQGGLNHVRAIQGYVDSLNGVESPDDENDDDDLDVIDTYATVRGQAALPGRE